MITPENIVDAKLGGASKEEIQALQQNIGKPSSQERIVEVTRLHGQEEVEGGAQQCMVMSPRGTSASRVVPTGTSF